jgi:hypothetical protein
MFLKNNQRDVVLRITYVKLRQNKNLDWHYQGKHFYNQDLELKPKEKYRNRRVIFKNQVHFSILFAIKCASFRE